MSYDPQRVSFAVPVTTGNYAPERIYIGYDPTPTPVTRFPGGEASLVIESAVSGAVVECWVCKPNFTAGGPVDGDFVLYGTITPPVDVVPGGAFQYRQIRVKSGGTSGTQVMVAA